MGPKAGAEPWERCSGDDSAVIQPHEFAGPGHLQRRAFVGTLPSRRASLEVAVHSFLATAALAAALLVGCQATPPRPVELPADAPLHPADCGWAGSTPLAFAEWATLAELGLPARNGTLRSQELVFAVVTRDSIEQPMLGAPGVVKGRGICARHPDGSILQSAVADDWQPPSR